MPVGVYERPSPKEKFFKKVNKTESCWLWTGSINGGGYGTFKYLDTIQNAHRAGWRIIKGEIPKGLLVLHKCDVRNCVNPDHLFLGTYLENIEDMMNKGRGNFVRGKNHGLSKLNEKEVIEIRRLDKHDIITRKLLSKMFKVNVSTIAGIVKRKAWIHI